MSYLLDYRKRSNDWGKYGGANIGEPDKIRKFNKTALYKMKLKRI